MRVDAAPDVTAGAWAGGNDRVRFRVGVHKFTASATEAEALAQELLEAIDKVRSREDTR
jgi:hypothetical protein